MTEIRPAQQPDRAGIRRVVEAAFGEQGPVVAGLVDALRSTGASRLELVVEVEGALVGHVGLSRSWVDAREALVDVLVLSPLSVLPEHQRRGLGTALVRSALTAAAAEGVPAVFLEGSPDFYAPRGFVRASAHGFTRPSPRIPDPAFQVALLDAHRPWMTGPLVYCEAFWAHDCVGLRDPLLADLEQRLGEAES